MSSSFIVCQKAYLEALGNRCAAELLYFFKQQRRGWFIITIEELRNKFFGVWGKDAIRKALALLDELGLVIRRHTRLNGRAWEYQFITDSPTTVVEESLTVIEQLLTVAEKLPTTYIQDPSLDHLKDPNNECVAEEMSDEEIKAALSHLSHLEDSQSAIETVGAIAAVAQQIPSDEPAQPKKTDLTPFFNRLRAIDIPLSGQIRELLLKKPAEQIARNILALEEEAAKNGLKNPIASCIAAITRNWQPRQDAQSWWEAAARSLGKERREKLIQNVTKLSTSTGQMETFVIFKTGAMLKLTDAYGMSWDAIAEYGSAPNGNT